MCVHMAIVAWHQYVGNPVVEKMAFNEALLLFIFFSLHWRRLRLAQARRRRIAAALSTELAAVVWQWRLTSHIAIVAALHLLQGNWLERRLAKPKSALFYQDFVPGWNNTDFKGNFCINCATFVIWWTSYNSFCGGNPRAASSLAHDLAVNVVIPVGPL